MHWMIITISLLVSANAWAERIATRSSFDPVIGAFSRCAKCQEMESLRTTVFQPALRDSKFDAQAYASISKVTNYGKELLEADEPEKRGPHYNHEVESFFLLALDAIPHTQDNTLTYQIALLKQGTSGASEKFDRIMREQPESCRKKFLVDSVKVDEWEFLETKKPKPKRPQTIKNCEAARARAGKI